MFPRFVLGFALTATPVAFAQGNDVYNFYFQKGGAPQSVIQGGAGQAAGTLPPQPAPLAPPPPVVETPAAPASAATVAATKPAEVPVARDYNRFELFLGPTRIKDEVGTGTAYTLGMQYNFNRYLGTRLLGYQLATESAEYTGGYSKDKDSPNNLYGGQVAFVFTPIHLDLLGHKLVRVSGLAGMMSQRKWNPNGLYSSDGVHTQIRPFVGASVGVSLNENFGVEGSVAMLDGGQIGQATGSLVFSF